MNTSNIKFNEQGLVPVIAQDKDSRAVLILAYADKDALEKTASTGFAHFYSRSRKELWKKGETSGNTLSVSEVRLDCDNDAVLYLCTPAGPACHTGEYSCFFKSISGEETEDISLMLNEIQSVLRDRQKNGDPGSYTAKMLQGDPVKIHRKVQEEAFETVLASEEGDLENLSEEVADLWFHSLMLLVRHGLSVDDVFRQLKKRRGKRRQPDGTLA